MLIFKNFHIEFQLIVHRETLLTNLSCHHSIATSCWEYDDGYIQNKNKQHRCGKGPVKLIEWVKIALLFLHVTSKLFQFTILKLSE